MKQSEKIALGVLIIGLLAICAATNSALRDLKKQIEYPTMGDYQLTLTQDSIYVWDNERKVGTLPLKEYDTDDLSTIILEDNQ